MGLTSATALPVTSQFTNADSAVVTSALRVIEKNYYSMFEIQEKIYNV